MEQYLAYLLKSAVWLSAFTIVYLIFLRNERFLKIKRWFLLSGMLLSLVLPLIKFYYPLEEVVYFSNVQAQPQITDGSATGSRQLGHTAVLYFILLSGTFTLLIRLFFNTMYHIVKVGTSGEREQDGFYFVANQQIKSPFSFFNIIFLNPDLKEPERELIIQHEMGHIHQFHWIDIMISELTIALQWVNPFIWICSRLIRENHEYLADEEVLRKSDPGIYKAVLLNHMMKIPVFNITQPFAYSLNKKRFDMMRKTDIPLRRKLKVLVIIPVLAALALAFSEPKHVTETAAFIVVEEMPIYPGGETELLKYIANNIRYPTEAREKNIQGRVFLRFIIDTNGKVVQPVILKGVDPLLDAEAIRVVSTIKGFVPGKQNGISVGVYYHLPITFSLEGEIPIN